MKQSPFPNRDYEVRKLFEPVWMALVGSNAWEAVARLITIGHIFAALKDQSKTDLALFTPEVAVLGHDPSSTSEPRSAPGPSPRPTRRPPNARPTPTNEEEGP